MRSRICGTGSSLPNKAVTNHDLSLIMDTSDEWIQSRTGIAARHLAVEETLTKLSVTAARQAMEEAKILPEEIQLIIGATLTPDRLLPSLACDIQAEIGAVNAVAFDINAACSGFMFGLATADAYIKSGMYQNALVIGGEILSKIMDWNDRSTCVLFGDGSGAVVVKADEQIGILGISQGSDGAKGEALVCKNRNNNNPYIVNPIDLEFVSMNGQEVYKFAVRTVPKAITKAIEEAGLTIEDIDLFLLHQANIRIIESVAKRLEVSMDKFPTNLNRCGNMSAGSVPVLLDEVNRQGQIKKGDKIVLAGFGAGLTWGAAVITW